jgi:low temperature requirement protein LtrA
VSAVTSPAGPAASGVATRDEKRVGWAELFFDLVYVFAVTQVSTLLFHDTVGWAWPGL